MPAPFGRTPFLAPTPPPPRNGLIGSLGGPTYGGRGIYPAPWRTQTPRRTQSLRVTAVPTIVSQTPGGEPGVSAPKPLTAPPSTESVSVSDSHTSDVLVVVVSSMSTFWSPKSGTDSAPAGGLAEAFALTVIVAPDTDFAKYRRMSAGLISHAWSGTQIGPHRMPAEAAGVWSEGK